MYGRAEDAVLVVEAPVVVEPAVERPEGGVGGLGVAEQRLLHADAERREQEAGLDPLAVEDLQAGLGVAVLRVDGLELTERAADVVGR